ncbi:MAG: Y4yA family PLP-dependent enzyme [Cryomorphaceae bacterium]|nr:Y4yA family PLP-dependent enzyme [Cryomorphaceae bacterium]
MADRASATREKDNAERIEKELLLRPLVHPYIQELLEEKNELFSLVKALGSPLNVLFPEILAENIESFKSVFKEHNLQGRVFFAHKTNQSASLVRQLAMEDACLDVSSLKELKHGLASGFSGSRIEATGPKNKQFLALCIQQDVTISVDSLWELRAIIELRKKLKHRSATKVLLRLSGFTAAHSKFLNKGSRFGITLNEIEEALDLLESHDQELDFYGYSFHLDTVSITERAVAIENCLELIEESISRDLEPRVLCIGGGYKVNYLEHESDWNEYTTALKESVIGTGESMTWQGNSFGMSTENGKIKGNFNSYNFYDSESGPDYLSALLSHKFPNLGDKTAGSILRDNMIELWIEPGRSLVKQCGITVSSVNNLRPSSTGDQLILLNMKRQDVTFLDQEIFVDPLLIYRNENNEENRKGVYFAGNLCLESDLVYRHKTFLRALPEEGDLVVFPNTAGYFMDFSACTSMMEPIARKVAIKKEAGKFVWCLDEEFSVV